MSSNEKSLSRDSCNNQAIVIVVTLAARQAALLHGIVEKNVNSRDARKREFVAKAASSLFFLGARTAPGGLIGEYEGETL